MVTSELEVPADGVDALERAFEQRLRLVENHPGFRRLEVWRDEGEPGRYLMVSWWQDEACFRAYMRSPEHRASHARVPRGPTRPRAVSLHRFSIAAE